MEKNTGQQYFTMLSLNDCLDLAVERCAIFFRKVEIRQTRGEELVLLLSSLEAMWQGRRKGSSASIKSSSSSGSSKKRGKRKSSPPASNSNVGNATCPAQDAVFCVCAVNDLHGRSHATNHHPLRSGKIANAT